MTVIGKTGVRTMRFLNVTVIAALAMRGLLSQYKLASEEGEDEKGKKG